MDKKLPELNPDETEIRLFNVELRAEEAETPAKINGYAAIFNVRSEMMWGFQETIEPGFFDDVLDNDTRALFNHDSNFVLGRKASGTLDMTQDAKGLKVDITPPDTDLVRDLVLAPMKRGDINQMSFAFRTKPGFVDWKEEKDGTVLRILKRGGGLRLYDVSIVTTPAYPQTSAEARSFIESFQQKRSQAEDQAASEGAEDLTVRQKARRRRIELTERSIYHE